MFGSAALDTAIGLVTIFLMLSLICSAINEAFASFFNRRGGFLRWGIARIYGERRPGLFLKSRRKHQPWTSRFYDDRRIEALCKDSMVGRWLGLRAPSYIDPLLFGSVTLDLATGCKDCSDAVRLGKAVQIKRDDHRSGIPADMRLLLVDAIQDASRAPPRLQDEEPAVAVRRIEAELGKAFDRTMQRVGGWYRRRLQIWLFGISIVVTLVVNADALVMVRQLSIDPTAREALAKIGTEMAKERADAAAAAAAAGAEAGAANGAAPAAGNGAGDADQARLLLERTRGVTMPLGWDFHDRGYREWRQRWEACVPPEGAPPPPAPAPGAATTLSPRTALLAFIGLKFLGLMLTAVSVALGAPFWFDVLQKLSVLRGAGTKVADTAASANDAASDDSKAGDRPGSPAPSGGGTAAMTATTPASRSSASAPEGERTLGPAYWEGLVAAGPWRPLDDGAAAPTRLRMAQLSAIAYRPGAVAEVMLTSMGMGAPEFIDQSGTQLFVARLHDDAVVSFRGTEPTKLDDLLADARIAWKNAEFCAGRVHGGFLGALLPVLERTVAGLKKHRAAQGRIWITGHSLGGALASLLYAWLAAKEPSLKSSLRLVTFGCPRVGDDPFTATVDGATGGAGVGIAMERDPVPLVPPWSMGYRHIGKTVNLSVGGLVSQGEGWRALLDALVDASTDLRRASAESLRRHGIEVYIAALERHIEIDAR